MISINTASRLFSKLSVSTPQGHDALSDLNLTTDDVVEGQVLKELEPGTVQLLIRGKTITAQTGVPLKAGMRLSLKLSPETAVPTLKLLNIYAPQGRRTVNLAALRAAIDENVWGRVYEALDDPVLSPKDRTDIKTLMEKVSQMIFSRAGEDGLRALIDASGLTWESKLAGWVAAGTEGGPDVMQLLAQGDLKGLISKVFMNNKDAGPVLKPLITALDNIGLLNVRGSEQTRTIFLPLPFQFAQGAMGVAQILLQFPREDPSGSPEREKEEERSYSVAMLLELSTLGALRAELVLKGTRVQGRFLVDKKEALECIETHLISFSNMLQDRGFTMGYMGCQLAEPETVTKSLVNEMLPQEGSSICFVA